MFDAAIAQMNYVPSNLFANTYEVHLSDGYGAVSNMPEASNVSVDFRKLNEYMPPPFAIENNNGQYYFSMVADQPVALPDSILEGGNTVEVKDMVELIKEVFGLNHVQIASIVGVSRPSLYNHINGKETPKDMEGYTALFDVAKNIKNRTNSSLKHGLKSVLVEGRTLFSYLKDNKFESSKILDVALEVSEKIQGRSATIISKSEQLAAVRHNSRMG